MGAQGEPVGHGTWANSQQIWVNHRGHGSATVDPRVSRSNYSKNNINATRKCGNCDAL